MNTLLKLTHCLFFFTRHKKIQKGYIINSECILITLTKKFDAVIARGVTSDRIIFGANLIWIWNPWLCWKSFRSSKQKEELDAIYICYSHTVELLLNIKISNPISKTHHMQPFILGSQTVGHGGGSSRCSRSVSWFAIWI